MVKALEKVSFQVKRLGSLLLAVMLNTCQAGGKEWFSISL